MKMESSVRTFHQLIIRNSIEYIYAANKREARNERIYKLKVYAKGRD